MTQRYKIYGEFYIKNIKSYINKIHYKCFGALVDV